jgi:hypothetical protein
VADAVDTPAPGTTIKLSIPGAVNLPDLPVVESRPGEDLFRPQRPVDAEHKPSLPVRRPRPPEPAPAPPAPETLVEEPTPAADLPIDPEPAPLDADTRTFPPVTPQETPQFAQATNRPPLPQRRRQQNLAPQLKDDPSHAWPQQAQATSEHNREETPEQARSRLSAFQAGTRRGRHEQVSEDTLNGRSAGNGQHRSE